ncbi:MAG: Holliday junction branch migration protein RuvA [Actinobacteria bacterium]|nr:MAG: Holliday junction branch migration protein RuvA [Actinomycetota bacterium]
MIALVRGEVAARGEDHVVLMCGGVGYRLSVSAETLSHLAPVGGQATLHSHLVVREDALQLYGFYSAAERELFLMLISVQKVGPKVALGVLSAGRPADLLAALAAGDASRFQSAPGVGKRTAERIVVELRERVAEQVGGGDPIVVTRADGPGRVAREGLLELGLTPVEADALLRDAEGDSPEELIADALRRSGGERGAGAGARPEAEAPANGRGRQGR